MTVKRLLLSCVTETMYCSLPILQRGDQTSKSTVEYYSILSYSLLFSIEEAHIITCIKQLQIYSPSRI